MKFKILNSNLKSINKIQMFKTLSNWNLNKNFKLKIRNYSKGYKLKAISCRGQALIGVLAVVAISSVIVSSLVINSLIGSDISLRLRQSSNVLDQAETALHNSILELERDPAYTGETLTLSSGQVIIEVTDDNPKIITVISVASDNKIIRKLRVEVGFDGNGVATVDNWVEL